MFLLLGLRVAVFRRTAFYYVSYVNVFVAVEVYGVEHFIQKFAAASYERLSLQILVFPGTFADEHHFRLRIADADNDVVPCFAKSAFAAVFAG